MAPTTAHAQEAAQQEKTTRTDTVTLITGDVVHLSTYPGGKQAAQVRTGPVTGHRGYDTVVRDKQLYLTPKVAQPYVRNGLLDERLFNITALAANGHTDAQATSLPLILEYATDPVNVAGTRKLLTQPVPAGAHKTRELPSVGSVAVNVARGDSARFWEAVDDDRPTTRAMAQPTLPGKLKRIWLDDTVKTLLDGSVPLVGAPAAWQAGLDGKGVTVAVLDTGVDTDHPDLAGQVVESANFSSSPEVTDKYGHGTHVAGILAGTGVASGGRYKGIAPGARVLNGKVLSNNGSGTESQIIAGMEWAAARAKIVSMSLGARPTDGTDPMSQAVNRLSAQHGTLFVIAAGNAGPSVKTVASPGAADAALTVAASTKSEGLAYFSSKGPRVGDSAVKPEIAAPGYDIVAARAAGTLANVAVGEHYARLGGTSMATPHVSGAAAILAQQHPDWTGQQLKAHLTSTSKPLADLTVYEQGAGRLDVARGVTQKVTASTGVLSMGRFTGPYGNVEPVRKTVTYRNDGDTDVTVDLALSAKSDSGAAAGPDVLGVTPVTLTVPARGTAQATVSVDPDTAALALYSGRLVATGRDGTTALVTAVGFEKELLHTLTLKPTDRNGGPGYSTFYVWNLDTAAYQRVVADGGPVKVPVRPGEYLVYAVVGTMDAAGLADVDLTAIAKPQVTVNGDAEIAFDARTAKPVNLRTPKATEHVARTHSIYREVNGSSLTVGVWANEDVSVVPSEPAARGTMEYVNEQQLEAVKLTMRIAGPNVVLHPRYLTPDTEEVQRLDGRRKLPALFVGAGRPDDYDGRDVRGKVALVRHTAGLTIENQVAAAAKAKAAMVVVLGSAPGLFRPYVDPKVPLPTVGLSQAEGADLLRRLSQGKVNLELDGIRYSPFRYHIVLPSPQIPNGIEHVADAGNTAVRHVKVYAVRPNQIGGYTSAAWRPYTWFKSSDVYMRAFPFEQDLYYTANDTAYDRSMYSTWPDGPMFQGDSEVFKPGPQSPKTWFKAPMHSGTSSMRGPATRTGDWFYFTFDSFVDSDDHVSARQGEEIAARVFRNGELVGKNKYAIGWFEVGVAEPATYRVEFDVSKGRPDWNVSTEVYSAWTFRSQRPAGSGATVVPTPDARWDLDLGLDNAAAAGKEFTLRLDAGSQRARPGWLAKVWMSYNDGGTWDRVALSGDGVGKFTGTVAHPPLRDTTGYVSLRYEINDTGGGKLEQTIIRAYVLR